MLFWSLLTERYLKVLKYKKQIKRSYLLFITLGLIGLFYSMELATYSMIIGNMTCLVLYIDPSKKS